MICVMLMFHFLYICVFVIGLVLTTAYTDNLMAKKKRNLLLL